MQIDMPDQVKIVMQQVRGAVTRVTERLYVPPAVQRAWNAYAGKHPRFMRIGGAAVGLSLVALVIGLLMPRPEPMTRETVLRLPETERQMLMQQAMLEAAAQPDVYVNEIRPHDLLPLSVFSGEIHGVAKTRQAMGMATIYEYAEGYLLRLQGFSMTNGPQLHVMLSASPSPQTMGAAMQGRVDLGALKGNTGDQNYAIPAGTDLNNARSVVIYSEPFAEIFAVATLRP